VETDDLTRAPAQIGRHVGPGESRAVGRGTKWGCRAPSPKGHEGSDYDCELTHQTARLHRRLWGRIEKAAEQYPAACRAQNSLFLTCWQKESAN
jgi:hypothetical protein